MEDKPAASIKLTEQQKENFNDNNINNPLKLFLFALKSLESKRQYPKRLKVFFDYGLDKYEFSKISIIFYLTY